MRVPYSTVLNLELLVAPYNLYTYFVLTLDERIFNVVDSKG